MQRTTISYTAQDGWSEPFPDLDSPSTLVVAFGAPEFRDDIQPLSDLYSAYPNSAVTGCSSSGEIHGDEVRDGSITVGIIRFDDTRLARAAATVHDMRQSFHAGEAVARQLIKSDLRAIFVLSDGLAVNGSELVRGITSVVDDSVIVTGGLAGDGDRFENTWVLCQGKALTGMVKAVALYGDAVQVGHGSQGGWDPFGPERLVTRSAGSVLYELDGKPALPLYKQYLGELATELPASGLLFPLALRSSPDDDTQIVRTILAVDEDAQSLTFAGDVPQGHLGQLMQANFDRLIDGAETAASLANATGPGLAVAISCVGRRLVLGARTDQETEATRAMLGGGFEQVGFYSYGEISPLVSGSCDLHNQTMTITTFSEG